MYIKHALTQASQRLKVISPSPQLDAQLLLADITGHKRTFLLSHGEVELSPVHLSEFEQLVERRALGEPVAYIRGVKEFYGREFVVNKSVLIPRPETEALVERGVALLKEKEDPLRLLDLGTGSGCIVISIAAELRRLGRKIHAVAVDNSLGALNVAEINAKRHEVNVDFRSGNWFGAIGRSETFQLIVSNPPYIDVGDTRVSPETKFEPTEALYSEDDGLKDLGEIVRAAPKFLSTGGSLLVEIGHGQGEKVSRYIDSHLGKIHQDFGGLERVVEWTFT